MNHMPCPENTCLYEESIGSCVEAVEQACAGLRDSVSACGFSADTLFNLDLLAHEFINNAVTHGNKQDPQKKVHVRLVPDMDRSLLLLTITDEGRGFNWKKASKAVLPSVNAVRGRGLAIGAEYAEKIFWNRAGNSVTLIIPCKHGTNTDS